MKVKFTKSITLLARLDHDFYGDPMTSEEWTFDEGEELEVSSIDWSEPMKVRKGKKRTVEARFAKLNIEEQKGYIWMVPEDCFILQ
jgi:hypothetical protein